MNSVVYSVMTFTCASVARTILIQHVTNKQQICLEEIESIAQHNYKHERNAISTSLEM